MEELGPRQLCTTSLPSMIVDLEMRSNLKQGRPQWVIRPGRQMNILKSHLWNMSDLKPQWAVRLLTLIPRLMASKTLRAYSQNASPPTRLRTLIASDLKMFSNLNQGRPQLVVRQGRQTNILN